MVGVKQAVLMQPLGDYQNFLFMLFILSTVLIAGAGNAINDYFDVRADRLNRPNKIVVGKTLQKRWAIIIHWAFNALGFFISLILSISLHSWFFLFIHLFSSTLLWVYSVYLKKILFWSNVSIAFLVGLIPLISLTFFKIAGVKTQHTNVVLLVSLFAFLINLSREIIKDIQDVQGDQLIKVRSLPIVIGIQRSRNMVSLMCISVLFPFTTLLFDASVPTNSFFFAMLSSALAFCILAAILNTLSVNISRISLTLKLSMFAGVISLFLL
ncbi:MAG: geranylgeranylglycerol-phosphate geranylgeranyltransferase [Bacteroidetes bacterium]|nr:geranylgeranylglycerol-phosphate geranylgeranyltransferase [Bacteroidota bacterium]